MNIILELIVDAAAFFYWLLMILINKTLRVEIINEDSWEKENNVIFALWHQDTFVPFFYYGYKDVVMFVMESFKGQLLGWCGRRLGYKIISLPNDQLAYGSAKGILKFKRALNKGHDGMLAVDGPLGPYHKVKPGIFYLARACSAPIVPCGIVPQKYWTLKNRWDKYIIPYPFSRVKIVFGDPYLPEENDEVESKKLADKLYGLLSGPKNN
ncbi:lysophospholipid acyltransferase family protein [Candidatus Margulisiibacteriota bacterium]